MRQPSTRAELYAWHDEALEAMADARVDNLKDLARDHPELMPPISEDEPHCGWFKVSLARGSVPVPARIYLRQAVDQDGELTEPERLICEIGDDAVDPVEAWSRICVRPIKASEYRYLMAVRAWAKSSATDQPQAQDGRRIDWLTVTLPPVPKG